MLNLTPCLALLQGRSPDADAAAAMGMAGLACGIVVIGAIIGLAIAIAIILFLGKCLKKVPAPYRKMEPGMVWLLIIPLFNLVWNFFVYKAISESYQGYFQSQGRTDVGDCGKNLGLAYCICSCLCIIPVVNMLAGIATLVLFIMCLVKFAGYKNQIPA
ncbi:hypothetical protein [Holophaga foetida]|uniref:hypothetical protein n=1 Tax=Holophaga foetida TaxID=35839 RepID=UPI00024717D2|nr:hypothetical protein [Holophaga foetida]